MLSLFVDPLGVEGVEARLNRARSYMGIPPSNLSMVVPLFVCLMVLPFWFIFVLPLFVLYCLLVLGPRFYFASKKETDLTKGKRVVPAQNLPKWEGREFDVVVFGVTGHSGLLLAEYLIVNYVIGKEKPLKIALAGRNHSKLAAAQATLSHLTDHTAMTLPLIIADSSNEESLEKMCKKTKVVGTTVGPFLKYGEGLACACARTGTGYCDLTGEVEFARIVNAKYDRVAKQTGARVLSFTGFDSVPSDIGTMALSRKFAAKFGGKTPKYVDFIVTKMNAEAQGGTVDTMVNLIENGPPPRLTGLPLSAVQKKKVVSVKRPFVYWNKLAQEWTIPFFMAPVNSKVVQWTNASSGLFEKMTYNECQALPSFLSVVVGSLVFIMGMTLFLMKPTRDILFWLGLLPKPGQGPSREKMKKGFSRSILIGSDDEGNSETLTWDAVGDPGGFATAVYQGECCVALVEKMVREGGDGIGAGITVGESIGDVAMLQRLRNTG